MSFWNVEFSKSWNLIWLSACTFESLLDSLSNLKLISSNLLVRTWNWFSISESFNRCLVSTYSEFDSEEKEPPKFSYDEVIDWE